MNVKEEITAALAAEGKTETAATMASLVAGAMAFTADHMPDYLTWLELDPFNPDHIPLGIALMKAHQVATEKCAITAVYLEEQVDGIKSRGGESVPEDNPRPGRKQSGNGGAVSAASVSATDARSGGGAGSGGSSAS